MFGSPAGGIGASLCEVDSLLLLFPLFNLSAFHPRLQFCSLVYSIIQKTLCRFEGNGLFSSPIFTACCKNRTKLDFWRRAGNKKKTLIDDLSINFLIKWGVQNIKGCIFLISRELIQRLEIQFLPWYNGLLQGAVTQQYRCWLPLNHKQRRKKPTNC